MSYQASSWYSHTVHWLTGVDPALAEVFERAMGRAGYPEVGAADALEAILADFLAGYHGVRLPSKPKEERT